MVNNIIIIIVVVIGNWARLCANVLGDLGSWLGWTSADDDDDDGTWLVLVLL